MPFWPSQILYKWLVMPPVIFTLGIVIRSVMKNLQAYSFALVMASIVAAPAAAYAIDVEINGKRVAFTDAAPMRISGRVMVPLRPVLEAMQINVEYDPIRREVKATEATKEVIVRLGSREATANGRIMTLDVPAQELNGRTYIPLRFFGEALGAVIDWNETMQLVSITGRFGVGTGSTTGTGNIVSALSLDSEAKPWFVGGETVKFSLQSDPGLSPTLYLNGGNTLIPMREVSSGRYEAQYVIPNSSTNKIAFLDDTPFAIVMSNGKQIVVPLKQQIALDNTAPLISNVEPSGTGQLMVGRPVIGASLSDSGGSGVDLTSVTILVDGVDVTSNAAITRQFVSYRPSTDMAAGTHTFRISAKDMAGNSSQQTGRFTLVNAGSLVVSAKLAENKVYTPGDEMHLSGQVSPEVATVDVRLGTNKNVQRATLGSDGQFNFYHTVSKNDSFDGSTVSLILTTKAGVKAEYLLNQTLSTVQEVIPAPTLNETYTVVPNTGGLILTGTAPGAKFVRLAIQPVSVILGVFKSSGSTVQVEVAVNADGTYKTPEIAVGKVLGSKAQQYVVKFKSVTAKGRESEEVEMTLAGK